VIKLFSVFAKLNLSRYIYTMATYPPPSFFSNIFDSNAFNQSDGTAGLTEAEADLLYYKYPVGQAFQTLQQTDHTGLATFNAGIDINTGTLKFPDNTVQTTAAGSGGGETLAQTLVLGNSAGATDINMNNNDITNCATINTVEFDRGNNALQTTSINIGDGNLVSTANSSGFNVAIGSGCLANATFSGESNIAFGNSTFSGLTSGSFNLGIGSVVGTNMTTGQHNVAIGYQANQQMTSGSYCLAIGDVAGSAGGGGNTAVGSTAIGRNAKWTGSNQIVFGTANETVYLKGNAQNEGTTTMLNQLYLSSGTVANRQITSSYYNFYDWTNGTPTLAGRLYGTANTIVYDSADSSSSGSSAHIFYCYNVATVRNVLQLNYASASMGVPLTITTNLPATATSSFTVVDSSTGNQLNVIPNAGNVYNPSADVGNIMVLGTGTQNAETLQLTTWSATNNYVKVRPTSVGIGAGGTSNTATTSVECNGTTVRISPSITFPDNTVQTTAFTGAVAGINQMWSWNCFNITTQLSGGAARVAEMVLPYSSAITFSTCCRIEFNYAIFSNSATTQTVIPNYLSAYTGQSGGTNTNPNTISMVDLVYNPTTQTMNSFIVQSTYSKIFTNTTTTYWRGNSGYNFVPIRFDAIAPLTLNSPSAGLMTVKFNIGYPSINYSSNPNYLGNLCSIATSIRITASQATTTDTIGVSTYSSGVAYFI